MKLAFGKFAGWDTDNLARAGETGRSYLRWCVENLDSPRVRAECERSLREHTGTDVDLAARALVRNCEMSLEEARYLVREEIAQQEEDDRIFEAVEAAGEAVIATFSRRLGVPAERLRGLARKYEYNGDWRRLSVSQFSSRGAYEGFRRFMGTYEAETDAAYKHAQNY